MSNRAGTLTQTSLGLIGAAVASAARSRPCRRARAGAYATPAWSAAALRHGPALEPMYRATSLKPKSSSNNLTTADPPWQRKAAREHGSLYERRHRPRKIALEPRLHLWSRYISGLPGASAPARSIYRSKPTLARCSTTRTCLRLGKQLSRWIEQQTHLRAAHWQSISAA